MGFPTGFAEQVLPKLFFKTLSLLITFLRTFIQAFLRLLGLSRFLEPQIYWPDLWPDSRSVSASIIQEMLPVMKFSDIASCGPLQQCAVCLYEFRGHEQIRRLRNCCHIFHRACVDRWIDHDQITCPLCRTPFVPDELMEDFHEKLAGAAAVSAVPEFGGEFSVFNNFL